MDPDRQQEDRLAWDQYVCAFTIRAGGRRDDIVDWADRMLRARQERWKEKPIPATIKAADLKPGDQFKATLTLVRPLDNEEEVKFPDGQVEKIFNLRGYLWWASAGRDTPELLVCMDLIDPTDIIHKSEDGVRDLQAKETSIVTENPVVHPTPPYLPEFVCCECGARAPQRELLTHKTTCSQFKPWPINPPAPH